MPIKIANAPVSWGIYEFKDIAPKFPYSQVLDEIAASGYVGLELGPWGYLPTDPAILRPELEKRGLQLLSSYVPVKLAESAAHEAGEAQALEVGKLLAALGATTLVLADDNGSVPDLVKKAGKRTGLALDKEGWKTVAEGVNRIAKKVHGELGLRVAFHHHCAGYVETPDETLELLLRTDPDLVGLCLDTGHYTYAGGDALQAVREFRTRITYLHLKDCNLSVREKALAEDLDYFQAVQAGVFCELGQGAVDFKAILSEIEKLGYEGWAIVEQDILTEDLSAPKASAERNRAYLRGLGY